MKRGATYQGKNNESGIWETCGAGCPGRKVSYAQTTTAGSAGGCILGIRLHVFRGVLDRLVRMTILEHRHQRP